MEKNPTAPAIEMNPPESTRAPGTPANFDDHTGAYPKATCVYGLPAGVGVQGA